jgi:hypothetical protein
MRREPLFDFRMFVRSIVVEQKMDIQARFNCLIDLIEETKKLLMTLAWVITVSTPGENSPFRQLKIPQPSLSGG